MRLAIVGFGLIGGSLALAARARGVATAVTAVDRPASLVRARERAAADTFVDVGDTGALHAALAAADLTVLAAPVSVIEELVAVALESAPVVTDAGSTKRAVTLAAARSPRRAWFVPGHPMAGLPSGGVENARADLFEGRQWLLSPEGVEPSALGLVERLVSGVGATPERLSVEAHDRAVAVTSHVPQLLANALVVLAERGAARSAVGPAFEGATRVAGGAEAMWRDIFATNADEIARALAGLEDELGRVRQALARQPPDLGPALALLERARLARRS